jgi:hypothetical protein
MNNTNQIVMLSFWQCLKKGTCGKYRAGCCGSNALDLYLRGIQINSQLGH